MALPSRTIKKIQRMRGMGRSVTQIANACGVGRSTVSDHTKHIVQNIAKKEPAAKVKGWRSIVKGPHAGMKGRVVGQTEPSEDYKQYLKMVVRGEYHWVLRCWTHA